MKIWKKQEMDECPQCGEKETAEHVLACKEELIIQQFLDSVEQLDEWMVQMKTTPDVCHRIKAALLSWKDGGEYKLEQVTEWALRKLLIPRNKLIGKHCLKDAYQCYGRKLSISTFYGWNLISWAKDGQFH